jgi:hypothetical protein
VADPRIERAFAAIQVAHTELHKTPVTTVTTACWTHISLARRLLAEYIECAPVKENHRG